MPNQVFRFDTEKDFTEYRKLGEPVSDRLGTWQEVVEVRDRLRVEDPDHYYNIRHFTSVKMIDRS